MAWNSPSAGFSQRISSKVGASSVDKLVSFNRNIDTTSVKEFCGSLRVRWQISHTKYLLAELPFCLSLWGSMCLINDTTRSEISPSTSVLSGLSVSSRDSAPAA